MYPRFSRSLTFYVGLVINQEMPFHYRFIFGKDNAIHPVMAKVFLYPVELKVKKNNLDRASNDILWGQI